MTIGAVLVGLALLLVILPMVVRPLTARGRRDGVPPEPRHQPQLEPVLAALRNLDFDHQTGKVSEEDYTPARAGLLAKAAQAMTRGPGSSIEDVLEERVKEIRRQLDEAGPAAYCAHCGSRLLPADRFCSRCGNPQTNACPSCGRTVGPEDRYCVKCGSTLRMEAVSAP